METNAALVRTDDVVVLYTVAHVCLNLALVVNPCDAELIHAVGDAEALYEVHLLKFRVFVVLFFDCSKNFFYCLMILGLVRETTLQVVKYFCCIHCFESFLLVVLCVDFACEINGLRWLFSENACKVTHLFPFLQHFVRKISILYTNCNIMHVLCFISCHVFVFCLTSAA